ncbi:MAG: Crp/Fnr family transcriptional regulator [Saprospiraceae bacterium]|nr:Crp/Fnr family transcriptional regulator [Saprospiraceae bacterium]MDZ4706109.1 Crp/Fnr family transcriptional regulator [Saprospiraceae bacterium]
MQIIDENILITWGTAVKRYAKNEVIFEEGTTSRFYYQIKEGSVKMFNTNEETREFTQGVFTTGDSFGEPPLFINELYPSTAIAMTDSIIFKLSKDTFFKILTEYPTIQQAFTTLFAQRVYSKSNSLRDIVNHTPEERIISFLNACKKKMQGSDEKIKITFTRQEIANFTGLRVETVIRTLKKMEEDHKVTIDHRKLYY